MENNLDLLQIVRDQISIVFKNEEDILDEKWSKNYKKTINCSNPKGFSQKAHCAARKKRQRGEETKSKSPFK
jgi:hypothetical protein